LGEILTNLLVFHLQAKEMKTNLDTIIERLLGVLKDNSIS